MLVDGEGKLWIATRGGISIYQSNSWSRFSIDEGLSNSRIWPVLPLGNRVYLGSSGGGVEILNLDGISRIIPKIVTYPAIVSGHTAHLHWRIFSFWGEQVSSDIETRYRMDDEEWSAWNRERHIVVGDLASGDHRFLIQAKNLLGNFDPVGQIIPISVPLPFYAQVYFIVPMGILSLTLIAVSIVYLKRKQKDDATIRKSESRYRNLFERANDAIIIFDPESEIIFEVNRKACELYGFSRDEFVGMNLKSISENISGGESITRGTLLSDRPRVYNAEHFTQSGELLNMFINASVIDYDGKKAILSLNRDITELKKAEEVLRAKIEREALVLRSVPIVFYSSRPLPDMATTWISEQSEQITGFRPEQFIKDTTFWESRLHPDDRVQSIQELSNVFTTGRATAEYRWKCIDGIYHWFADQIVLVRNTDGTPKEIVGTWLDITERKQSESEIRLLAQTVASAKDCFSITDLDGKILFVNDAFMQAHGYKGEELLGENISIVNSAIIPYEISDQIKSATIQGGWYGEIHYCRKDGTDFPVELWLSVVYNEQNEPVALVGVSRDISERKRYEEEREKLIHELKKMIAEIKTLSGLLPICSKCKKIRDDQGYWTQVETYVAKRTDATFTHGICPDCTKELFPDVYKRMKDKGASF